MSRIPIAVDIMGGDDAPEAILEGSIMALNDFGDKYYLYLVGDATQIKKYLSGKGVSSNGNFEIVDAPDVVGMGEHPVQAIRHKPKSSINVSVNLVKEGKAAGVFSAGNTGAAVGASFLKWRMLEGLARPCIATQLPADEGNFLLLDAGATVDCSPLNLAQFAIMGDIYARLVMKKETPKVGLLSNGTEEGKGNKLTQDAFKLLQEIPGLNFIGNVEGHDLFSTAVDVVVCDGFVGNVLLKSTEQVLKTVKKIIKANVKGRPLAMLGGLMMKGVMEDFKKRSDPAEVGGAPLLGVNGYCVIGHGNSTGYAARNGIRQVGDLVETGVNQNIIDQVHELALDLILP